MRKSGTAGRLRQSPPPARRVTAGVRVSERGDRAADGHSAVPTDWPGHADISLEPLLARYPHLRRGYLIELKYLKRSERFQRSEPAAETGVVAAVGEATAQLERYLADERLARQIPGVGSRGWRWCSTAGSWRTATRWRSSEARDTATYGHRVRVVVGVYHDRDVVLAGVAQAVGRVGTHRVDGGDGRAVDSVPPAWESAAVGDRRMLMRPHHNSQRSDRLPVTAGLTVCRPRGSMHRLEDRRTLMMPHHDSQRSDRLPVTQPVHSPPTFRTSRRSLTARAARLAGAFAFSARQAAGSVWRRLSPRSFTDHRNRPGSLPPDSPSQNRPPALPVNHIHNTLPVRPAYGRCRLILKEPHARAA